MQLTQDGRMMPTGSESVCLNDITTAKGEGKRDGVRETKECSVQKMRHRGKQKRRHQRCGWWGGVCVCVFAGEWREAASQDPEGARILELVFAFQHMISITNTYHVRKTT